MPGNPLPSDGVPGLLTDEQQRKLKEFWLEFYRLVDNAPEEGSGGGGKKGGGGDDKPGKDIPKDDAAKEKMKAEEELREAKAALEKYGSRHFLDVFWRFVSMDDPDNIMLRFCRARKWKPEAGVAMLSACMKWRIESGIEDLFYKGEEGMKDADGYLRQFSTGKTYAQGTDRMGRPVVYIHVKLHKTSGQPPKVMEDFVLGQMEAVRCLMADRADKVTLVFDMTGFGLANMDWRVILLLVKCLEAYYPESLNCLIIHSAPFVFQGIWKILAPMLDPVVRAKVQMTKNTEDLVEHIPKEHLVKKLGGSSAWEWEFTDVKDGENEKQHDKATRAKLQKQREAMIEEYTEITRKWAKTDDEVVDLQRQYLCAKMRWQYFQLDPYIRGRTVYHRHGNVVGNGLVHFEYPGLPSGDEWQVIGFTASRETSEVVMDKLAKKIKALGGKLPASNIASGDADDDSEDEPEEKPRRRRKSTSGSERRRR